MAAAGYMTEVDTESIWNVALDTTRFGKINVRMGEMLNFWITGDAATDITDTKVLPILEQLSEEALMRLMAAAKEGKFNDPWTFVQANVSSIMSQVIIENAFILKRVQNTLYGRIEIVSRDLDFTTRTYNR